MVSGQRKSGLFIVTGVQRTGTNLLREILNSNPDVAMLGEVFTPAPAPAHWENFIAPLPSSELSLATVEKASALLDRYFEFVEYRIRNHWIDGDKSRVRAIGVDIKVNQLRHVEPQGWPQSSPPFLVEYLKARGAIFIHTTRRNVIHCAISAMIAEQRNLWHDYDGVGIDRSYHIEPRTCIDLARSLLRDRDSFFTFIADAKKVECRYEDLVNELSRASTNGVIHSEPGPLKEIARVLGVEYQFRDERRLRKAINVPYTEVISNRDELFAAVSNSRFEEFARTIV
jgi:LPS sulfotransferase NodH